MNQSIISHSLIAILFLAIGFGIGYSGFSPSGGMNSMMDVVTDNQESDSTNSSGDNSQSGDAAVTVSSDNLTEGQAALARALGINPDEVTITQAMIVCAEGKLGSARVDEIKGGATPSFGEGVKLAGCYTSN